METSADDFTIRVHIQHQKSDLIMTAGSAWPRNIILYDCRTDNSVRPDMKFYRGFQLGRREQLCIKTRNGRKEGLAFQWGTDTKASHTLLQVISEDHNILGVVTDVTGVGGKNDCRSSFPQSLGESVGQPRPWEDRGCARVICSRNDNNLAGFLQYTSHAQNCVTVNA